MVVLPTKPIVFASSSLQNKAADPFYLLFRRYPQWDLSAQWLETNMVASGTASTGFESYFPLKPAVQPPASYSASQVPGL